MKSLLFIGTHLSQTTGSLSASETIYNLLQADGCRCQLVSRHKNKLIRLLDITFAILFRRYDVANIDVYSGGAFRIAQWSSILLRIRKKHIIMSLHGGMLPEFSQGKPTLVLGTLRRAHLIQTPSHYLKSFFEANYGMEIKYVPNPIDLERFEFRTTWQINRMAPKLLWVRAFNDIYRPELAVKVLSKLRQKYAGATLTMIGPDKGTLDSTLDIALSLGITDAIYILGPVKNEELSSYYKSHDVLINTTRYESFGISLVEAALCGIAIVSTSVGEIPSLWKHGEEIALVEKPEEELFLKEILSLIENPKETKIRIQNARKRAEAFSWDNIAPTWINYCN